VRDSLRALRIYALKQGFQGRALANFCRGKSGLLLNIGCGPLTKTGWINIDLEPRDASSFYFDVRNGLPLANGSVKHIHSEHFLGYLDYEEALGFLRDCSRMLQTGGTMRMIVPDLETYIRAYAADDAAFFNALRCRFSQVDRSKINDSPPNLAIDGQDWWRPFESLYANLLK